MRENNFFIPFKSKVLLLLLSLLYCCPSVCKDVSQRELDSLEIVLFSTSTNDTSLILRNGNYIVENTNSEQQKFRVLQKISESYFRGNNINKSVTYLFQAQDVAEKLGDPEIMAQAYGSIANQYSYLSLTEKARTYLNKAIQQIEKLPEGDNKQRLKALSYLELGNLEFNNENFKSANKNYRQSLKEFQVITNPDDLNTYHYQRSLYNIGNSFYYLNEPDSAEANLIRALLVTNTKSNNLKYYIYSTLSEVYSLRHNYQRSIDTLKAVLTDTAFDIHSLRSEVYLNLSKNYKALGDTANYAYYTEKHLELRKALNGEDLDAISTAFDVEQQNFISSISQSHMRNRFLLFSIVVLVLISSGIIIFLNLKKKKEQAIYQSLLHNFQKKPDIPPQNPIETESVSSIITVPQPAEADILQGLQKFEQTKKFRNSRLTLSNLAVQLKTNPTYLSAVIKTHKYKNFNTYVNELRIGYICDQIHKHPEYLNYKISYLAEDCGFTSHSTFSTVFKNVTGISPSVFLREEEKHHMKHSS